VKVSPRQLVKHENCNVGSTRGFCDDEKTTRDKETSKIVKNLDGSKKK
jgi:hypothetical protein